MLLHFDAGLVWETADVSITTDSTHNGRNGVLAETQVGSMMAFHIIRDGFQKQLGPRVLH